MAAPTLCGLSGRLLLEVATAHMPSLPVLMTLCSSARTSLRESLGCRTDLELTGRDATFALAELLVREARSLEWLSVDGRHFNLRELRQTRHIAGPFTESEAVLLAPLLRSSELLRWVSPAGRLLDVSPVIRGSENVRWGSLSSHEHSGHALHVEYFSQNVPSNDAECIFVVGLLPLTPTSRFCRRRPRSRSLQLDSSSLGRRAEEALRVARRRSGVATLTAQPREPTRRKQDPEHMQLMCFFFLAFVAVLLIRIFEDGFAKEQGYAGALMPWHVLKASSFAERLKYELLV